MTSVDQLLCTVKKEPASFIDEWKSKADGMRKRLEDTLVDASDESKRELDAVLRAVQGSRSAMVRAFVAQLLVAHLLGLGEVRLGEGLCGISGFVVKDRDAYNGMALIPTLESTRVPKGAGREARSVTERKSMQNRYKNFFCFREKIVSGRVVYTYDPSIRSPFRRPARPCKGAPAS
jgi:hypothetical protein